MNKHLPPRFMHSLKIALMNNKVAGYISFVCLFLTNSGDQNRPRPLIYKQEQNHTNNKENKF